VCLLGISSVGGTQWWRTATARSQSHTQSALLSQIRAGTLNDIYLHLLSIFSGAVISYHRLSVPRSHSYLKHFMGLHQWRRQAIKSDSAFKGQPYFQVGQMKGPTVPNDSREAQSAEVVGLERGAAPYSPSPLGGLWAMSQKNFQNACFLHFCKLKWFHLQRREGNFD